jgi:hypothetical protein
MDGCLGCGEMVSLAPGACAEGLGYLDSGTYNLLVISPPNPSSSLSTPTPGYRIGDICMPQMPGRNDSHIAEICYVSPLDS